MQTRCLYLQGIAGYNGIETTLKLHQIHLGVENTRYIEVS
jgi:hypothetical protein